VVYALAAVFVVASWWASTGAILWLDRLPRTTFRVSLGGATALAAAGFVGLWWSSRQETVLGAYVAFGSGLAVWGWHELTFLLGVLTGPRKLPCPPDARGPRRFWLGAAALIHHELALAATLVAIALLTRGGPDPVGTWTFFVLWVMRLSSKLNVFLGVRNLHGAFVPPHLRYLLTYTREARWNWLMPVSLLGAGATLIALVSRAGEAASPARAVGFTLVATLLALGILEHLFLALPVRDALLWRWATGAQPPRGKPSSSARRAAANFPERMTIGTPPPGCVPPQA